MSGLWYTRELPQLAAGEMIEFACDYAQRTRQHCALALRDRWTLWVDTSGAITGIETRTSGAKNRPFTQAEDDPTPLGGAVRAEIPPPRGRRGYWVGFTGSA